MEEIPKLYFVKEIVSMGSRGNIDKYSKEELYNMCNELIGINELYKGMLDTYVAIIVKYEKELERKNNLIDQYSQLTDEMLNTIREMTE